jgi:hypothetical protein
MACELFRQRAVGADLDAPQIVQRYQRMAEWQYPGVTMKHLPRHLPEWSYRFNRRGRIGELDGFLMRRAVGRGAVTYAELVARKIIEGAT